MKKILLSLAAIAFSLSNTRSENLLSESFTYLDGPIVAAPGSPWLPNTGTPNTMLVSNLSLEVSTSRSEDIAAPLSRLLTNDGVEVAGYASFNVRFLTLPTTNGAYFA